MVKTRRDLWDGALRSACVRISWANEEVRDGELEGYRASKAEMLGTVESNRSGRAREQDSQERVISLGLSSLEYERIFTCASDALVSLCYSEFPSSLLVGLT